MTCPSCGSKSSYTNDARGETVCTDCGTVLTAGVLVDSLTFSSGHQMQGSFIDTSTGNVRGGFAAMYRRESQEISLARGFNNLERVAQRLQMAPGMVEASKRLYRLALQRGFTSGRNNFLVVSACLYAVCRREKGSFMLIDFSDALLSPVKTLAQVFTKLVRCLSLRVPSIDPSLFMDRYAHEMNLGAEASKVAHTGVRLVQAMSREWITTGRRPLGLCAASLLIAARYHKIRLNAEDINAIFRIAAATVSNRLYEFKDTAVAAVAMREFETIDLLQLGGQAALPPCVLRERRKRTRMQALTDGRARARTSTSQSDKRPRLLFDSSVPQTPSGLSTPRTEMLPLIDCLDLDNSGNSGDNTPPDWTKPFGSPEADESAKLFGSGILVQTEADEDEAMNEMLSRTAESGAGRVRLETPPDELCGGNIRAEGVLNIAGDIARALEREGPNLPGTDAVSDVVRKVGAECDSILEFLESAVPLTAAHLQRGDEVAMVVAAEVGTRQEGQWEVATDDCIEELLPDPEEDELVESVMLSAEERDAKARMWDELWKDVMKLVYERQRERRRAEEKKGTGTPRRKKEALPAAESALASVKSALLAGKSMVYERRINEEALQSLFGA